MKSRNTLFCVPRGLKSLTRHQCRWRAANFDLYSLPWPLSSEGSLACQIYCDTEHPLTMVISEDPWHTHTCCQAFGSGAVTTCFNDLGLLRLGFEHPTVRGASALHHLKQTVTYTVMSISFLAFEIKLENLYVWHFPSNLVKGVLSVSLFKTM